VNLCEIDWIQGELSSVDIIAKVGPYITRLYHGLENAPLPKRNQNEFVVMSYAGSKREEFYGIDKIISLAEKLPSITFKIVGTKGECYNKIPNNVLFLGWISSTREILEESSIFIRIPEHDGLSLSVLEALYYGKQVVFSFPLPYTHTVTNESDLYKIVNELYNKWMIGEDIINNQGKDFVEKEYFDKQDYFLKNLKNELV